MYLNKIKLLGLIALTLISAGVNAQEVILLEKPSSNKVIVKFMFRNGSITDPQGKEGLTGLTASLMMEGGTDQYSKSEIEDKVYPMAANYYHSVDKEVSVFTFQVPVTFLDDFYEIMTGLVTAPSFKEEDFQRVKSNTLNYVTQVIKASSDEEYSKMALEDLLFRGTNYQHMVAGTEEGLNAITLEDVKAHYQKYFTQNNLMLGVAGNFPGNLPERLKQSVSKLSQENAEIPEAPQLTMPEGIQVEIIEKENALGSAIYAGYPLNITRENDEFAALMIANSWLGEHRKSYGQLYQEIRDTRSMNYGDYTYIEWYEKGGSNQLPLPGVPRQANYFSLWIRPVQIASSLQQQYPELSDVEVGHAHFALRLALRKIQQLVDDGISEADFELTRDFLISYINLYIQTPTRELGFLMDSRFYNRENYIEELRQLLEKVTLEDVNNAIKKYLQTDNMYITIITDDSETGPLAESLRENKPSPMSYSNIVKEGLPESVLSDDAEIATYPLNIRSVEIIESENMFIE